MDTSKKLGMALQEYGGKFWSIRAHTHTPTDTHTHTKDQYSYDTTYTHTNSTNIGMHPYAKVINGYYAQTLRIKQTYF